MNFYKVATKMADLINGTNISSKISSKKKKKKNCRFPISLAFCSHPWISFKKIHRNVL